MVLSEW